MDAKHEMLGWVLRQLIERLDAPGWDGPHLARPEDVADFQSALGQPVNPEWRIWFEQSARNSRNPADQNGRVMASISFDNLDQLLENSLEAIVNKLTIAMAGQAAHEVLEWIRFDGELVLDPHNDSDLLGPVADQVAAYLKTAGP